MAEFFSEALLVGATTNVARLGDWWQTLTLGGFVGAVLWFVVVKWMPRVQKSHEDAIKTLQAAHERVVKSLADEFGKQRTEERDQLDRQTKVFSRLTRQIIVALTKAGVDVQSEPEDQH